MKIFTSFLVLAVSVQGACFNALNCQKADETGSVITAKQVNDVKSTENVLQNVTKQSAQMTTPAIGNDTNKQEEKRSNEPFDINKLKSRGLGRASWNPRRSAKL